MINIQLNGEKIQLDNECTIESLLINLNFQKKRLAVEVNQAIIPRSSFAHYSLNDSDKVEIVQAIGGG